MNTTVRHIISWAIGAAIWCLLFDALPSTAAEPGSDSQSHNAAALPPGGLFRLGSTAFRANEAPRNLRFSHDSKFLAALGADEQGSSHVICVWSVDNGLNVKHQDQEFSRPVQESPNGRESGKKWRIVRGADNAISVVNRETGAAALHFAPRESVAATLSPDESMVVLSASDSGIANSVLEVWQIATKTKLHNWETGKHFISHEVFTKDGKLLIGGGYGLFCWDLTSGKELVRFPDRWSFGKLLMSPDGRWLATEGITNIDVFEMPSCKVRYSVALDGYPLDGTFSDDSRFFATGCGFCAQVLDLQSGKKLRGGPQHIGEVETIVFSRGGKRLASLGGGNNPYQGHDVIWWDLDSRQSQHFAQLPDPTVSLSLSADGLVAIADRRTAPPAVWDARRGRFLPNLSHSPPSNLVAASRNGDRVTASPNGSLNGGEWRGHVGAVAALAVSADGLTAASIGTDRTLRVWKHGKADEVAKISLAGEPRACLALAEDGSRVVAVAGGRLFISKSTGGNPLASVDFHDDRPAIARFSRDGKRIAVGTAGGRLAICDAETGQTVRRQQAHKTSVTALEFGDGDMALYSGGADGAIIEWNPATLEKIATLDESRFPIDCLLWISDGKRLGASDESPAIAIYDATTRKRLAVVPTFAKGNVLYLRKMPGPARLQQQGNMPQRGEKVLLCRLNRLTDEEGCDLSSYKHSTGFTYSSVDERVDLSAAISPDGTLVAQATPAAIRLWDTASGNSRHDFLATQRLDRAVAFSHSGKLLAAGGAGGICVWQLDGKNYAKMFDANSEIGENETMLFSPDDRFLMAWGWSDGIRIWDSASGQMAHGIESLRNVQTGQIAFAMRGRLLLLAFQGRHDAVVTSPARVAFFELATGARLGELAPPVGSFTSLALSDDDRRLALGQANGTILICDGKQWLDKLYARFPAGESPPMEKLWDDLGDVDPSVAYAAIGRMCLQVEAAQALLKAKLPALEIEPLSNQQIDKLIQQLGSDDPALSHEASSRLLRAKPEANSPIKAALAGNPAPEVRARLELLLAALSPPSNARLRVIRAVQALERIATPAARELLASLAAGPARSELAREAKSAVERLNAASDSVGSANRE